MTFFQNFARNNSLSAWTLFNAGLSTPANYSSGVVDGQYRLEFSGGGATGTSWVTTADGLLLYRPLAGQQWMLSARISMSVSEIQAFGGIGVFQPAEIDLGAGTRNFVHVDSVLGRNANGNVHRRAVTSGGTTPSMSATLESLGTPGPLSGHVAIIRRGTTFYIYYSRNGFGWILRHTATVSMPDPCYAGLMVQGIGTAAAGVLTCDYIRARSYR